MRTPFLCLVVLATLALSLPDSTHGQATVSVQRGLSDPPPEAIYEVDPGERPGYILTPGYWRWNGSNHIWVAGRWVEDRKGSIWTPDHWEQRGKKWYLVAGRWDADSDSAENEGEEPASVNDAPAHPKKIVRQHKKIDYSDPNLFPRYRR